MWTVTAEQLAVLDFTFIKIQFLCRVSESHVFCVGMNDEMIAEAVNANFLPCCSLCVL